MRMRRWRWSEFARPHLVFSRFLVYPIGKPPLTIGDASHRSCAWNADTLSHGSPDVPEPQPSFIALFRLAKREALLGAQGDQVIELIYGLSEDPPLLAERVGEAMHLSDERIRQILRRSVLIMHCLGIRQITLGERAGANARLLLYLDEHLRPEEAGALDRMLDFAGRELAHLPLFTHALPLLVYLLYGRGETVRRTLVQLRDLERKRSSAAQV